MKMYQAEFEKTDLHRVLRHQLKYFHVHSVGTFGAPTIRQALGYQGKKTAVDFAI